MIHCNAHDNTVHVWGMGFDLPIRYLGNSRHNTRDLANSHKAIGSTNNLVSGRAICPNHSILCMHDYPEDILCNPRNYNRFYVHCRQYEFGSYLYL